MKSTLSDCEPNWLKEFASVEQFRSAAEARAFRNSFPLVGCSDGLGLCHIGRQSHTERLPHRNFRVVFVERDVDRRFQLRHGVRL
jgi:hypothetical protein